MKQKTLFQIEITDTFGGEPNYSWIRRYQGEFTSRQAMFKALSKAYHSGWKWLYGCSEYDRYNHKTDCKTLYVWESPIIENDPERWTHTNIDFEDLE